MAIASNQIKAKIVVIGAGIGGLTAGALLAKRGYQVTLLEQAVMPGGCASTFKRKGFTFDVGATQVAGLEPGGIHQRIFSELDIELPRATFCDPACAVFLPGETKPVNVWRDRQLWQEERQKQFPGSESFWQLLQKLFEVSWQFQARDPVLPPRNLWDLGQLVTALRPNTLLTLPFTLMTVGDALKLFGLEQDRRLKTFLDMQLKLYSQVGADETALLYAATALAVSQAPQGLFHLQGSMQVLSDRLITGLEKHGGQLKLRHAVTKIQVKNNQANILEVLDKKTGKHSLITADQIVANVTAQDLVRLVNQDQTSSPLPRYQARVKKLSPASGAFVIYLGVDQAAIPKDCPPHLQFLYSYDGVLGENNSLFVSVSKPGDGRAKAGQATIIASSFTDPNQWWSSTQAEYESLKQQYTDEATARLGIYFDLTSKTIIHQETATPRTFAKFTSRQKGIVGGIGQRVSTFGPFGFATRTPIKNLWLVGDSTHPGEGTAGVSYSALTVVRQIEAISSN